MAKGDIILNLSDVEMRRRLWESIKSRRGLWWFGMRQYHEEKTLSQLAYCFGVVYPCIAEGMTEAWGEELDADGAHEFCKEKFLKVPIVNHQTGELMGHSAPSLGKLDKDQMSRYLEQIIKFAREQLNVEVPEADRYRNTGSHINAADPQHHASAPQRLHGDTA